MKSGILLSGGMDSVAIAYWMRPEFAITINYGQIAAEGEIRAARAVAKTLNIKHEIITIDCRNLGAGDLTGTAQVENAPTEEWWAFRNQFLLTIAGMKAVMLGINNLIIGSVKTDIYQDGKAEFFEKINALFAMQEGEIKISAPAINLTTSELIKLSNIPRSILAWSHSCSITNYACGNCRSCVKHLNILEELNQAQLHS